MVLLCSLKSHLSKSPFGFILSATVQKLEQFPHLKLVKFQLKGISLKGEELENFEML
jgi:hypothetical protein